jgi:hypothetical protein
MQPAVKGVDHPLQAIAHVLVAQNALEQSAANGLGRLSCMRADSILAGNLNHFRV